jgi:hypothetical protein
MRKRIITLAQQETASPGESWLELESLAEVEITSEDAAHPIESALQPERTSGGAPRRLAGRQGYSSTIRKSFSGSG